MKSRKIISVIGTGLVALALLLFVVVGVFFSAGGDLSTPSYEQAKGDGQILQLESFDGLTLAYRYWPAEAPLRGAITLFHGGGGHSGQPTFTYFIDYFNQRGFAIYGLDQRGHGYSDGRRYHIESMEDQRRDMDDFIAHIKRQPGHESLPVFAVAQSMGGVYLLDYSIHHPDALTGVVVTAPGLEPHGIPKPVQYAARFGNLVAPRWQFELPAPDFTALSRDPAEVDRVAADDLSRLVTTPRTMVNILDTTARVNSRAGELRTPLLLAHGESDAFADPAGSQAFFENVPAGDKELIIYKDAYHQLYLDIIKEDFFADVERWIDSYYPK